MSELGPKGQRYIFRELDRLGVSRSGRGGRGGRGRGGGRGADTRRVAATEVTQTEEVSDLTRESEFSTGPGATENGAKTVAGTKGTRNGSSFGSGAYNN